MVFAWDRCQGVRVSPQALAEPVCGVWFSRLNFFVWCSFSESFPERFGVRWQAKRDTALDRRVSNLVKTVESLAYPKRCRASLATALQILVISQRVFQFVLQFVMDRSRSTQDSRVLPVESMVMR